MDYKAMFDYARLVVFTPQFIRAVIYVLAGTAVKNDPELMEAYMYLAMIAAALVELGLGVRAANAAKSAKPL